MTRDEGLRQLIARIIESMRSEGPRYKSHDLGFVDSVSSARVDDWADELEAALALPSVREPLVFVWLLEKTVDGSPAYWDGGHAESFTRDPNAAVQWVRREDAMNCCKPRDYAQWGWHYVEHGFISRVRTPMREPADRTIAVAIVPAVANAGVEIQVASDLWLHGTTNEDGYVAFQWSDSLGDSALRVRADGFAPYLVSVHWKTATDPDAGLPPLNSQMTVGGNLPPLESLTPPPPDVLPADEDGPIRITWPTMSDPTGSWRWKGFSDFLLFWRYLNGEDLEPLLADRISVGATVLRVFAMVSWDDISPRFYPQDYPNYYFALSSFVALLAQHRLRVEFVLFCDCRDSPQVMPDAGDRDRHQEACIQALRDAGPLMPEGTTWNVFVEVANEPFKNLPGGNEEAVERAHDLAGCGFLVAAGNYDAQSSTNWEPLDTGDYGTTHAARTEDWPRKCKDLYDLNNASTHDVWIGDEPTGAAEVTEPGRRDANPDNHAWYHGGAALFSAGSTFHCDCGTHSTLLEPQQRACAIAAFWALDWVPTDAPYWNYQRGDMGSEEGIGSMPILHDDALESRSYCKGNGSQEWCLQIQTTRVDANGNYAPVPRDGWRVVETPRLGFVYLEKP